MSKLRIETESPGISRRRLIGAGAAGVAAEVFSGAGAFGANNGRLLNVGIIGLGSQGRRDLYGLMSVGAKIVALCDVDERQIAHIKREAGLNHVPSYTDYRTMLKHEARIEGVVIATPDHWHAILCRAALHAGKHVYCEKPLARTVGEARLLRLLARSSKCITQMGNQGSASTAFRRSIEVIQADALGRVDSVHAYIPGGRFPRGMDRPSGGGGAPRGLNWDFWVGPAAAHPYRDHLYHPFDWRGWYDFGSGHLGDFGCHAFNLPVRALDLGYPDHIEVAGTGFGRASYFVAGRVVFYFPSGEGSPGVTLNWYDDVAPPTDVFREVIECYGELPGGVLLLGDNGLMYTSPHNMAGIVKLRGDKEFRSVLSHEGLRSVPISLPRVRSHVDEWVHACGTHGRTYSDFDTGGHLTEIVQAGVLALRLGHGIDWNGARMEVDGVPEAETLINPLYRTRWMNG